MLGLSLSEWLMVGVLFVVVVAAPRVGKLGEMIAAGSRGDDKTP